MTQIVLDNHKKEVRIDATCHADGSATLKFTGPSGEATLAFAQPVDLLNLAGDMLRMARFGYSGQGEIGIPRAIDALFTAPPLKGTPSEDTIVFVPLTK